MAEDGPHVGSHVKHRALCVRGGADLGRRAAWRHTGPGRFGAEKMFAVENNHRKATDSDRVKEEEEEC